MTNQIGACFQLGKIVRSPFGFLFMQNTSLCIGNSVVSSALWEKNTHKDNIKLFQVSMCKSLLLE